MTARALVTLALVLTLSALAFAQAPPAARELLRASAPGAYAVRYLPDRALISSSTKDACELRVNLPQPPLWGYLGKERQPASFFAWDAEASVVVLKLQPGAWEAEVGWEGTGERPRQGQRIALLVDDKKVADLSAAFSPDQMTAQVGTALPQGSARAWLDKEALPEDVQVTLTVGDQTVSEWRPVNGLLQGRGHLAFGGDTAVTLVATGRNLLTSPVGSVRLEILARPVDAPRVDFMPEGGIVVEAEDFTGEGEGRASISVGEHVDQHGGESIYNYGTGRHWLEWTFEAPETGTYDLFARVAAAEAPALREVTVDGRLPAPGFEMVRFPVTGGWAHTAGEWWVVQVAGAADGLPGLSLERGKHVLRMQSVGATHLNVDYLVLKRIVGIGF